MVTAYPQTISAEPLVLPQAESVAPAYVKRFRMDLDLNRLPPVPVLPPSCYFAAWDPSFIEDHAEVLFESFHDGIDAIVFPSLSSRAGCKYLMADIGQRRGFVPQATWLVYCNANPQVSDGFSALPCGSIQGVRTAAGFGAIQNVGVIPERRGRGLGSALLLRALHGFAQAGLKRAYLEVTASNEDAIRLYRNLGFRKTKTLYKSLKPVDLVVVE
jgi:ribosomal protein S18 acetylase RimI-like enzyme